MPSVMVVQGMTHAFSPSETYELSNFHGRPVELLPHSYLYLTCVLCQFRLGPNPLVESSRRETNPGRGEDSLMQRSRSRVGRKRSREGRGPVDREMVPLQGKTTRDGRQEGGQRARGWGSNRQREHRTRGVERRGGDGIRPGNAGLQVGTVGQRRYVRSGAQSTKRLRVEMDEEDRAPSMRNQVFAHKPPLLIGLGFGKFSLVTSNSLPTGPNSPE
ncbi:hypothetical protein B0H19DRAFT_1149394 [Mycena capillaripes]|nr:hypothetical protein B0H19DRAFT_1149394 [Mycena capillaripes]